MARASRAVLCAAGFLSACTADIVSSKRLGDIDPNIDPARVTAQANFSCTEQTRGTPTPLHRLGVEQYRNTLKDLFSKITNFDATAVADAALQKLPRDEVLLSFSGIDNRLSDSHVEAFYETADTLATAVVNSDANLKLLGGNCASVSPLSAACIDAFLQGFAARAYRRPLDTEELADYRALNDGKRTNKEVFRALLFSVLMAPQFLYQTEINGTPSTDEPTRLNLSAYELASRLSYHFWQTLPDAELWASAESGALLQDAELDKQITRLASSEKARVTIDRFYREWFDLGRLTTFRSSPAFSTFVSGTDLESSASEYLAAADQEILDLTRHYTWSTTGTLSDLLLTDVTFTRSPKLSGVYGVSAWSGQGDPVHLKANERSGILTRMAFLTSGTYTTHPIHRGAVVRRRLMCSELSAPSAASLPPGSLVPPPPDDNQTTRTRYENKVVNEPCASCHALMNPIGYVLEQYDAVGRFRTSERIFDEATGKQVNQLPINSVAAPRIKLDDTTTAQTGAQLSQALAESSLVDSCFARQYFRFTFRRDETTSDSCTLERLRKAVGGTGSSGGSLRQAFEDVARDESFRTRILEQP